MKYAGRVGFAIGTGRCGTLFLYQLLGQEPDVASSHERNPENEAFHRYCMWNHLAVDDEGFLATKEREVDADLDSRAYSFEASPYLAVSVRQLHERFGARFVLLMRRPDGVVTSFAHKGFYRKPYAVRDPELAIGFQDQSPERFFTFFARIAPKGPYLHKWNAMTQVGRVAWFWRAYNERIREALNVLPRESYEVVRIEDLDYARYQELSRFLGYRSQVSETTFDSLRNSKPHAFWRKRNVDQWNEQESREFESEVGELATEFGYEYRVAKLVDEARAEREESIRLGRISQPKPAPRFWRVRRATASWLREMSKSIDVT